MKACVLIALVAIVLRVSARPTGAPVEACSSLIPQHFPNVPRSQASPITLDLSSIPVVGYEPESSYRLTLGSSENLTIPFKGFIIQARTQPTNDLVGSFIITNTNKARLQECQLSGEDPVSSAGTVTHNNPDDVVSVEFLWVAPPAGTGTLQFEYSVVHNFSTYWVLIRSTQIFEDTGIIRDIEGLHYSDCGTTRACYREPYNCIDTDCDYSASWMVNSDEGYIEVEMTRNRRGWIALGFSNDNLMGDDDVFVCQSHIDGTSVVVKDTYNMERHQANMGEPNQDDISDVEWQNHNAVILCRFRRTLRGNGTFDKDLSTGMYYNFFAVGNSSSGSEIEGVGAMHTLYPKITTAPRHVEDVSEIEIDRPSVTLIKVHGAFMMFTWYFLAPVGIFLALFYKESFPNGLWFYGHIAVMIATIVFMFIGLILILVHADGKWIQTDDNQAHQFMGIICIAAPCINVIIGFFKGNPDGHYRWLFNLIHGTNGFVLSLFVAMVNIILGLFRLRLWVAGENEHLVRKSLYLAGTAIGYISVTFFLFNAYRLIYHKRVPRPQDLACNDDDTKGLVNDEDPTPAPDYVWRISAGIVMVVILLAVAIATIVLMAIS
ncbi:putative ferric-chelate reductase 1 [Dysidea avara]|uniref:putative ferric-chelate reductase 1 n=1 Tax=Dysidea avara TaxID=196820 RepID=UPI00332D1D58